MTVFLIILAIIVVLTTLLLNLSATFTVIYENGWKTNLSVLFYNKDIELSKLLSFVMFPEKKSEEVIENNENKKKEKQTKKKTEKITEKKTEEPDIPITEKVSKSDAQPNDEADETDKKETESNIEDESKKPAKPNPILKIWNEEGVVGILSLFSNALESVNSAILTFFRGLHIHSLYVMIIVGGGDAATIAHKYGKLCSYYYPVKGVILNGMKVDKYDDYIQPDFIADKTEFEMQLIASLSVGLLLRMVLKAGIVFLTNIIKNKKSKSK
ncbi:MAG: DUF2953 domain-containing protein [Eubacterium sp.]|nr:DUF2953 domain-containing protein [Eubacterium sp.]